MGSLLASELRLTPEQVTACLDLGQIRGTDTSVIDDITRLGSKSDLLAAGLVELAFVLDPLSDLPAGRVLADLSVARGLDCYTGTVYEGRFAGWPNHGSICSGGRYEDLAGSFIRPQRCPRGDSSDQRCPHAAATATQLRARGLNTELYHQTDKLAKPAQLTQRATLTN